ncbi:MAG: metal-dependent transcriptional regulator [Candidatus Freyrarchaeum guaymaensis]
MSPLGKRAGETKNMFRESDILKIVKEDILRILSERNKEVSLESIKGEVRVSHSLLSKAIKDLEEENLIRVENKFFMLKKNGREEAKDILRKHLVLENYFKKTTSESEAHRKAHIIEHYVSEEVIRNIKKLSTFKERGISLTELELRGEGIISDITIASDELFERIVSMGVFLGEKIVLTNKYSGRIIVKIKNKKLALDKNIAERIMVLKI